jgi:hypothetical protein
VLALFHGRYRKVCMVMIRCHDLDGIDIRFFFGSFNENYAPSI